MKIVKDYGQSMAHTKGFNPTSGPSTLTIEGDSEDEPDHPSDISSSKVGVLQYVWSSNSTRVVLIALNHKQPLFMLN